MGQIKTAALIFSLALATPAGAEGQEKLGVNAVPLTVDSAYLRAAPAPDYWAFAPFVKPQFTSSACSIASVTAAVNGLMGLPPLSEDKVMSQPDLLALVGDADWTRVSAEGGDGVTFDQLVTFAGAAMKARGLAPNIAVFRHDAATGLQSLRGQLAANEASAEDVLLVYFNQGVVTGDWDGPHISLIGAYDAEKDRVLILEVDQDWYVPYWTPVPVLLEAMLKPAPADQGVLAGQTGGLVRLSR
jgi:hypothetical protein